MTEGAGGGAPVTGALLDEILRGAPGLREAPVAVPDDATLVSYLAGVLTPHEAFVVERGLVTHAAVRRRVPQVAGRLDALQAAPWGEVAAATDGVALAWRGLAAARLAETPRARDRWLSAGWDAVRTQAAAGLADAQAAWSAFRAFADQWERARRVPRLAEARGGDAGGGDPLPDGVTVRLEADLAGDGTLSVRGSVRDASGRSSPALDGRRARLALTAGGDSWPLEEAVVSGDAAAWRLPGAETALGLAPGTQPTTGLAVTLDPPPPPAPDSVRSLVAADGAGGSRVDLRGVPELAGGRLRLTLTLPELTRLTVAGRLLALSVAVAPDVRQRLGAWPVGDWGDGARSLEVDCPGPDGGLDPALLSVDILAPPS